MDLKDYLLVLRRGWPSIVALILIGGAIASTYLLVTPKTFRASATLLIVPSGVGNVADDATGTTLASVSAPTFAGMISSPIVLDDVAERLRPQVDPAALAAMVAASQRPDTALLDITVTGEDSSQVADVANLVATRARSIIPQVLTDGAGSGSLRLVLTTPATAPDAPVTPSPRPVLAIGLLLGLVLGIGLAVARYALDTSIRTAEDVTRAGGMLSLGTVPAARRTELPTGTDQWGRLAERYRAIRTRAGLGRLKGRRSVLVASVRSMRDSHLVAAHLAVSVARAGRSVVLIDADLITAPLRQILGSEGSARGLGDVLAGDTLLRSVVQVSSESELYFLPAGRAHSHPTDLLSSPKMAELIRELEAEFDHVIVSAPAVLASTDASVLATDVETCLLVVARNRTNAAMLRSASGTLVALGASVLGTVLVERRVPLLPIGTGESKLASRSGLGRSRGSTDHAPERERVAVGATEGRGDDELARKR